MSNELTDQQVEEAADVAEATPDDAEPEADAADAGQQTKPERGR